ncbi:MAG: hypothetical protein WAO52_08330 [Prolixibacteraceae bacterium]
MDDYIFLIIAVIISIFAAIKKNKKKDEVILSDGVREPRNFLMDQLLGEDFLADSDDEFEEPVRIQPPVQKEAKVFVPEIKTSGLTRKGFSSGLPASSSSRLQLSVKPSIATEPEEDSEEIEPEGYLEGFSLRKAVIYSEILNPKY